MVVTLKYFLNAASPVGSNANVGMSWLLLAGVCSTKDGLSLSMLQKSWFIAVIGLNFAGGEGVGKTCRRCN